MTYFDNQYAQDKFEIESIDQLLYGVWGTLADCQSATGVWPYEIRNGEAKVAKELSVSTQAMVHYALEVANDGIPFHEFSIRKQGSYRTPKAPRLSFGVRDQVRKAIDKSLATLKQCRDLASEISKGSFGPLNPFTLAWLLPISREDKELFNKVIGLAKRSLERAQRRSDGSISILFPEDTFDITTHAFPVLRALQLKKMICDHEPMAAANIPKLFNEETLGEWFYSRLLDHIAFATIKDGPFDAAELAFSLEGYLLCRPPVQDGCNHHRDAIERAFEILESRQEITPYWRPLKPLLTNSRGFALLPLSVEIVNSLFRSCWLLGTRGDALFCAHRQIFRTYYQWIESRVTEGKFSVNDGGNAEKRFQGWYSEHLSNKDGIHTWETSQVGIYLVHYRSMLHRDVAAKCMEASGLRRRRLSRQTDKGLKPHASPTEYWAFLQEKYSPRVGTYDDVYVKISTDFVMPRDSSQSSSNVVGISRKYSMLLYGPPGTGKTGIAEGLAQALQWDFISLSPSDFVHSGVSQVEQRAKQIFDTLNEQENCVILLDEIDRLILDRSHSSYTKQDDMFQLMTPSMLPKLKELRSKERSIFVIATNYLERIEPAAIRAGRVDERLLVGLPDFKARCKILQQEIPAALRAIEVGVERRRSDLEKALQVRETDFCQDPSEQQHRPLIDEMSRFLAGVDRFIDRKSVSECAAITALASYSELKQLAGEAARAFACSERLNSQTFLDVFRTVARSFSFDVRIDSYLRRVGDGGADSPAHDNLPLTEIIDNCWLLLETDEVANSIDERHCRRLFQLLGKVQMSLDRSSRESSDTSAADTNRLLISWLETVGEMDATESTRKKMICIAEKLRSRSNE